MDTQQEPQHDRNTLEIHHGSDTARGHAGDEATEQQEDSGDGNDDIEEHGCTPLKMPIEY